MTENIMKGMIDYVYKAGDVLEKNIKDSHKLTEKLVDYFTCKNYKRIVIIASGSSYNASLTARLAMEKYLNIDVKLITPFNFYNYENKLDETDFVILISQSGRSSNTIEAVKFIKKLNVDYCVLTGNVNSTISEVTDKVFDFGMGEEKVEFVTLGYSATVLYLMLFAMEVSYATEKIDKVKYESLKSNLQTINNYRETYINSVESFIRDNISELSKATRIQLAGFGPNFGTVVEGALKVSETYCVPTTAFDIEEYVHGPYLEVNNNVAVIVLDSNGIGTKRCKAIYDSLNVLTNKRYLITSDNNYKGKNILHVTDMNQDDIEECLTPLTYVIAYQILAGRLCINAGIMDQNDATREFECLVKSKI